MTNLSGNGKNRESGADGKSLHEEAQAMCGIVGYIGRHQAAPFLIDGLSKLEYRGYDSSGIAVYHDGKIDVEKCVGRL